MNEENFEKGARRDHATGNTSREGYWQNERNKQNDYNSWGNNHYNRSNRPRFTNNRERVGGSGYDDSAVAYIAERADVSIFGSVSNGAAALEKRAALHSVFPLRRYF